MITKNLAVHFVLYPFLRSQDKGAITELITDIFLS